MSIEEFINGLVELIRNILSDLTLGQFIPMPEGLGYFINIINMIDNYGFYVRLLYFVYFIVYTILIIKGPKRLNMVISMIFGLIRISAMAIALINLRNITIHKNAWDFLWSTPFDCLGFAIFCFICLMIEIRQICFFRDNKVSIAITILINIVLCAINYFAYMVIM